MKNNLVLIINVGENQRGHKDFHILHIFLFFNCVPYVVFNKESKCHLKFQSKKRILISKFTILLKLGQSEEHHFTHGIRLPKELHTASLKKIFKSGGDNEKCNNNAKSKTITRKDTIDQFDKHLINTVVYKRSLKIPMG